MIFGRRYPVQGGHDDEEDNDIRGDAGYGVGPGRTGVGRPGWRAEQLVPWPDRWPIFAERGYARTDPEGRRVDCQRLEPLLEGRLLVVTEVSDIQRNFLSPGHIDL